MTSFDFISLPWALSGKSQFRNPIVVSGSLHLRIPQDRRVRQPQRRGRLPGSPQALSIAQSVDLPLSARDNLTGKTNRRHDADVTNDLNYPAVFLTTAEHDSRVIPGHTLKLAATLQGPSFFSTSYPSYCYRCQAETSFFRAESLSQEDAEPCPDVLPPPSEFPSCHHADTDHDPSPSVSSLCRIYQNTGHGDGKTTDQQIREHAEKLTFLARAMELEYVE